MNWIVFNARRLVITGVAFIGAICASLSGFVGGRALQHYANRGGASDWDYLMNHSNIALLLLALALACGFIFLATVWWNSPSRTGAPRL
jgi:hypothetical protein